MTFLPISDYRDLTRAGQVAFDAHAQSRGTPFDATAGALLGHVPSFEAYASLQTLRVALVPYIGERAVTLFSYTLADEAHSLVPSVSLRKALIESGEDPDDPQVTETEGLLIEWARLIATRPAEVSAEFAQRLQRAFNPQLRILLVAFAGQFVAHTVFSSAGRIPLDPALYEFRKSGDTRTE